MKAIVVGVVERGSVQMAVDETVESWRRLWRLARLVGPAEWSCIPVPDDRPTAPAPEEREET